MPSYKTDEARILYNARLILDQSPIWGTTRGICLAVKLADNWQTCDDHRSAAYKVLQHIRTLLDPVERNPHPYLQDWLIKKRYTTQDELETEVGMRKLRATRLAWIDDMIHHFEKKSR